MPLTSSFVAATDGTRLHVRHTEHAGDLTCVFVHGLGDGAYVWDDAAEALEGLCSLLVLDRRGHGDSEAARSGRYDLSIQIDDLLAVVHARSLGRLILVGHSFGGLLALGLAGGALQQSTAGLMLVDICPQASRACARERIVDGLNTSLRAYASPSDYVQSLLESRPFLSDATAGSIAQAALRSTEQGYYLKLVPAAVSGEARAADEVDERRWREFCENLRCPTTFVRGHGSAIVSVTAAAQLLATLPNAELITIPKAGHAVVTDNPAAFRSALVRFVRSVLP